MWRLCKPFWTRFLDVKVFGFHMKDPNQISYPHLTCSIDTGMRTNLKGPGNLFLITRTIKTTKLIIYKKPMIKKKSSCETIANDQVQEVLKILPAFEYFFFTHKSRTGNSMNDEASPKHLNAGFFHKFPSSLKPFIIIGIREGWR